MQASPPPLHPSKPSISIIPLFKSKNKRPAKPLTLTQSVAYRSALHDIWMSSLGEKQINTDKDFLEQWGSDYLPICKYPFSGISFAPLFSGLSLFWAFTLFLCGLNAYKCRVLNITWLCSTWLCDSYFCTMLRISRVNCFTWQFYVAVQFLIRCVTFIIVPLILVYFVFLIVKF